MTKWARLLAVFVILASICFPLPVLAEDIEIKVFAKGLKGITDFTVIYINETRMDMTWGYAGGSVAIMIRAKYGEYPDDITDPLTAPTDGYFVYYGGGVSTNDTSMDFDENPGPLYYKAWAQNADGSWEIEAQTDWEESRIVTLIGLMSVMSFLALALMIVGYWSKKPAVAIASSILWLLFGLYSLSNSTETWDVFYGLFILGVGLFIVCLIETMALRPKIKDEEPTEDIWDKAKNDYLKNKEAQGKRVKAGARSRRYTGDEIED